MARRVALAFLAVAALLAAPAHAASTPAHSKGKKGGASSCPAASCGLATAAQVAALQLYNTENFGVFTSSITLDSTNPDNTCTVVDQFGVAADYDVRCALQTAFNPKTLRVMLTCPTEGTPAAFGSVSQFWCEGYVTDAQGAIINGLPTYSSGFLAGEATCLFDISSLPDGTTLSVDTGITCSNYVVPPVGGKTAAAPKLTDLIRKN